MRYHDPLSFNILISDVTETDGIITTSPIYQNSEYLTPNQFEEDIVVVGQGDNATFEEEDND
tara:strand:- start:107 stop:292 length:186 start_codon:yes stop_codon:yes gene_type:complete